MAIVKGFIEGALLPTKEDGTLITVPYNNLQEASFRYVGESYVVETFNLKGDKVPSAACSSRAEASFELKTQTPDWSFLQAATGVLDAAATLPLLASETVVLAASATTVPLSRELSANLPYAAVCRSDTAENLPLGGDPLAGGETSLTLAAAPSATSTTQVRVTYWREPDATTPERVIEIGKGEKIKEGGVYGRFVGCGETLLVYARRAYTQPEINFAVGSNPAEAGTTLYCLTDKYGILATVVKLNPGDSV